MISKNNAEQFTFGHQVRMISPPFDRHFISPLQVIIREHLPQQHISSVNDSPALPTVPRYLYEAEKHLSDTGVTHESEPEFITGSAYRIQAAHHIRLSVTKPTINESFSVPRQRRFLALNMAQQSSDDREGHNCIPFYQHCIPFLHCIIGTQSFRK